VTRLSGERVSLVPVPHAVAAAVVAGGPFPFEHAPGWPHDDSADALRPHAEHGGPGDAEGTFLVLVDDEVVGECGWYGPPGDDGVVEIGYGLAASRRGRGLGTEAVAVLCAWVEQQPGVRRIAAEALAGNDPSWRLLLKLGFVEEPAIPPYRRFVGDVPIRVTESTWTRASKSG
jgi:RimJ/RimL family protein N-acetyltransferase